MNPDAGRLLQLLPGLEPLPSRRHLLGGLGSVGLLAASCRRSAPGMAPDAAPPPPRGRVLSAQAWAVIEAVSARILPSDDGPGAREANVIAFIDAQLATPVLAPAAATLVLVAEVLDRVALAQDRTPFAKLGPDRQDALLGALGEGKLPIRRFPQREVFAALHSLTLEGFLSDPVYGGNRDMVGWRWVDFAEPGLRPPEPGNAGRR
jgi:gluconate 2-dehydrogenase gamma chain